MTTKGEVRKRGLAIDELIGLMDDGVVVHIPTGFAINPPRAGAPKDPLAWIKAFLAADPKGWDRSRTLGWQQKMSLPLQQQLLEVVEAVGDR